MSALALEFRGVQFAYAKTDVLCGLDLSVADGEFVAVLGPNGCGKTTLVRLATRVLSPAHGSVRLLGEDLAALSQRDVARRVAVVPQEEPSLFAFSVEEIALMGRTPWLRGSGFEGEEDRKIARESLRAVAADGFLERDLTELSGGERQRVLLARALAQRAGVLILDEPTSHLDLKHRVSILRLLASLCRSEGLTVIVISHDVNLASRFADRLVLLADGRVAAEGRPAEVLVPEVLSRVYETRVSVRAVEGLDVPHVFPE